MFLTCLLAFFLAYGQTAEPIKPEELFPILETEMRRYANIEFEDYPKPYFVSLRVHSVSAKHLSFVDGMPYWWYNQEFATVVAEVRVGNHGFDESPDVWHSQRRDHVFIGNLRSPKLLRHYLWSALDEEYKNSCRLYLSKKAKRAAEGTPDYATDDFSREFPLKLGQPLESDGLDEDKTKLLERLSSLLGRHPKIMYSEVTHDRETITNYFISSEGSKISYPHEFVSLSLSLSGRSDRGISVGLSRNIYVPTVADLPSEDTLVKSAERLRQNYFELLKSSEAKGAFGPCLLDASAAAQLMLEFASALEGERQRDPQEPQTFREKLGKEIVPKFLSLSDDPTLARFKGESLIGHYLFDQEGIPGQPVILIKNGVLKSFLLSRRPVKGLAMKSNGHGRADLRHAPHARPGNLIVSSNSELSRAALKSALLAQMKSKGFSLGIIIHGLEAVRQEGGRGGHQTYRGKPQMLYFIYPDGREELFHNGEIVATPMKVLQSVVATGDDYEVSNLTDEGPSGTLGVSVIAPSLLISEIEVQKGSERPMRLPILKSPLEE